MKLKIQQLLHLHGLQHIVDDLKLIVKETDDLILLKYNMIDADWSKDALYDCRGLILSKKDWSIVSFPYSKFFNLTEGYCAKIDWDSAKFMEKLDGSLINLYFYNGIWNVQTSGTIFGDSTSNNGISTFNELFWKSVNIMYGSKDIFESYLNKSNNYMFELCTPENIVVTPHSDYKIILHGVRDMNTLDFINLDCIDNLIKVKFYDFNNVDEMMLSMTTMTWKEEGFVIVDKFFNRAKCKNPKYVEIHHTVTNVSPYSIFNVVKTNEIDEYISYFSQHKALVDELKIKWDDILEKLTNIYDTIKHITDKKEFALSVFDKLSVFGAVGKTFSGIMFNTHKGSHNILEGMCKLDNKFWFTLFIKKL